MRLTLVVLLWDTVEEEERQRVGEPERLGEVVAEEDTQTEKLTEAQLVELTEALEDVEIEVLALWVGADSPAAQKTNALRSRNSLGREGKQPLNSNLMVLQCQWLQETLSDLA